MNTLSTIVASLEVRLARLRDAAVARLAALKQTVLNLLADAGRHVTTQAANARQALGIASAQVRDHAAPAVVLDFVRPVRERLVARLLPVRRGLALVASIMLALLGTHVAVAVAGSISLGVIKLSLVVLATDVLLGFFEWRSSAEVRRNLRVAIVGSLASIALAAATVSTALDPGPTTSAVAPAAATPAKSPVVAAHDVPGAPGPGDLDPARPAERRTRRRVAGSNGRA